MDLFDEIVNFFSRLFRSRVDSARYRAQSKVMNVQTKARGHVARKVNEAIDKPIDKMKGKLKK